MRIALVHSYYSSRQPSGENVVVDAQAAALTAAGHEVLVVARHTDERERRRTYPLAAAWTVASGHGPDPTEELRALRPDVVHVHNLFPNFGTRWLAEWSGPLVATMHNFRPMCAAGTLYRDGETCTACPDGDATAAIRHGCYRGSRAATVPLAIGRRHGVLNDPIVHRADALVVLTEAARSIYRTYGVDAARLQVIPNFVDDPYGSTPRVTLSDAWLYVGRLAPEKGIAELLAEWPEGVSLDVYGDGPLAEQLHRAPSGEVRLMGGIDRATLRDRMPGYAGLVLPSRWVEGLPTVLLEALAAGLPCVAVAGSGAADVIAGEDVGLVVDRGATRSDWSQALASVEIDRAAWSARARAAYERCFTPQRWTESVAALYATQRSLYASVGTPLPVG